MSGMDYLVNLAAIVGDPACAKDPKLARDTNFEAIKVMWGIAQQNNLKKFVFVSTCSNYGKMENDDGVVDENSRLAPVSLYAETKVMSEQFLLSQEKNLICKPTCLRFSTAYGLSPRTRFDLTVNEFVKEIVSGRELIVFGEKFWRPYCHVIDLSRAIQMVIEAEEKLTAFEVYNVGHSNENYQKQMIVNEIERQTGPARIKYVHKDEDPRNYKVSFEKIQNKLGFELVKTVPNGISDLICAIKNGLFENVDGQKLVNVKS